MSKTSVSGRVPYRNLLGLLGLFTSCHLMVRFIGIEGA